MLVVNRKKSNIYRLGIAGSQRVVFYPGHNVFDDPETIERMQKKEAFKDLIKQGVHEIIETVSENTISPPTDITEMSNSDAKALIKKVLTVMGLESMFHQEEGKKARKGVLTAIQDKIKEVKSSDK